jgi:HAAS
MSDHEFDNYLALLSRLLRLGKKQRDAIAGELRSHLEDRLEELLARGVPRDEAVRQALEEFGDAAAMAAEFVSLSGNKRKRWIMRLTTASVAAIVLIAAGIFTFWPGGNAGPGAAQLVAQPPATQAPATGDEKPAQEHKNIAIKDLLDRRMAFNFKEVPLRDLAQQLSVQNRITIYLDARHLEEAGVNTDTPITHSFSDMRFRTFLDLMLGELDLTYLIKDDVLIITTPESAEGQRVIRVYDCRELLSLPHPRGSGVSKVARGGGFFAVQDEPGEKPAPAAGGTAAPPAGAPPQNVPGGGRADGGAGGQDIWDVDSLIDLITTIVDPDTWSDVGGPGSIAEYKGLISVASTQQVHEKVERLLNMLHQAGGLKESKVTVVE